MFQAYQHYFNQKDREHNQSFKTGTLTASSAASFNNVGNAARRGYRPMTGKVHTTGNSSKDHGRGHHIR